MGLAKGILMRSVSEFREGFPNFKRKNQQTRELIMTERRHTVS